MKQTTKVTRSLLVGLLLVLASFVVAAEVSTTAHDATVELTPEWSVPSTATEYEWNITNLGPDRIRQVWIYKNVEYEALECPERTGWDLSYFSSIDSPDATGATEACAYFARADSGVSFSNDSTRVFEFNATTPADAGDTCDLTWYVETIDSYSGTQGEAELSTDTTGIDVRGPTISSTVNEVKVDYKGNTYIYPEYVDGGTEITVVANDTNPDEQVTCQSGIDYCTWYYERTTTEGVTRVPASGSNVQLGNGEPTLTWDVTFPQDSNHTLVVNCVDIAGNDADEHTRDVIVDGTPPETTYETTGPIHYDTYDGRDAVWFDGVNTITFDATDNKFDREGITTQYKHYYYADEEDWDNCLIGSENELLDEARISSATNGDGWTEYSEEFTLDGFNESCNVIEYKSYDKLTNVEETKFLRFFVDKTPPVIEKTVTKDTVPHLCDLDRNDVVGTWDETDFSVGNKGDYDVDMTRTFSCDGVTIDLSLDTGDNEAITASGMQVVLTNGGSPIALVGVNSAENGGEPFLKTYDSGWSAPTALPAGVTVDGRSEDASFSIYVPVGVLDAILDGSSVLGWAVNAEVTAPGVISSSSSQKNFPADWGRWTAEGEYEGTLNFFGTTNTEARLACEDLGPHPAGDVNVYWTLERTTDGENWDVLDEDSSFSGAVITFENPSLHRLSWYCEDAVEKKSETDVEYFKIDDEAPVLDKVIDGMHMGPACPAGTDEVPENGNMSAECYLKGGEDGALINLSVEDFKEGGAAVHYSDAVSCTWEVEWKEKIINEGSFGEDEVEQIRFFEDSEHILTVTCTDLVGNTFQDVERFLVDMTPPTVKKTYGHPNVLIWDSDKVFDYRWITSDTPIDLLAEDNKVGVETLYYNWTWVSNETCPAHPHLVTDSVALPQPQDDMTWTEVDGNSTTFSIPQTSCHRITYKAVDKFGHESITSYQYVMVDNEAPNFTKMVGEPSIFIGEGGDAVGVPTGECVGSDFGGQVSPASVDGTLMTDQSCDVLKDVTTGTTAAADPEIYFLVDTTGSMSGPISSVKSEISNILDSVDADFGTGDYKDFPFDSYVFDNKQSITSDKSAVESAISSMGASGGNDGSEGQFYALQQIAENDVGFGTDATKIVVWFGDAPGHDPVCNGISGEADIDEASVTAALEAAGIRVIAISTTSGYDNGLDDDPTSSAGDYAGDCPISGTSGQATRIADATGGVHLTDVDSDEIVDAITTAIGDITSTTDIVPDASACALVGLDVSFDPATYTDVGADTTVQFNETILRTDEAADGTVDCEVLFRSGEEGGIIGRQSLSIGDDGAVGGGLDWFVTQETGVSLTCEDVLPHPVGNESIVFSVAYEGDALGDEDTSLTEQYCVELSGEYDATADTCTIEGTEVEFSYMEDSIHRLEAWCVDGLGNENDVDIEWFAVDTLAPETELDITEPVYEEGGVTWADTVTRYELDAEDPQPHPSGLDATYYRWNLVEDENFCWGTNDSAYEPVAAGFDQGFESNEDGWLDYLGANLTMVPSGTNGVTSAEGSSHATLSLGDLQSGGVYDGRRLSVFSRWGGYENVFPVGGYTTQVDVYLDTAWADGTDKRLDFSSAISTPAGTHQRDFIIHIGTEVSAGEFAVSSSNNAPGWARGAGDKQIINESGWYTLRHTFANNGGDLEVTYEVIEKSSGDVVYSRTQLTSDEIGTDVGGNRYGWFVVNEFENLPIDNTEKSGLNVVAWNEYDGQFAIPEESCHVIEYYSVDNLGNTEEVNTEFVFVDKTPPMITKAYEGPFYSNEFYNESSEEWYVAKFIHPDDTNVLISTEDVGPHPSGVAEAEYRITRVADENCRYYNVISDTAIDAAQVSEIGASSEAAPVERYQCDAEGEGDWTPFTDSVNVTVGEDSCHVIEVRAVDRVNKSSEHTQCVFVDGQAPTPNKTVGDPHTLLPQDYEWHYYPEVDGTCNTEEGIDCWKVTTMTPIEMACEDPQPHPVGNEFVYFNVEWDASDITGDYCEIYGGQMMDNGYCRVDGDAVSEFLFQETTEHKLSYYCEDVLGNSNVEDQDIEMFKVEEEAFEIELNKKWNLISVPFRLLNEDMEAVFDAHSDTIISVWGFNGTDWSIYTPDGVNNDDLNAMLPGYGYWVLTRESDSLLIGGSLFSPAITPPSIDVVPGWNLLGYFGTEGRTEYRGPGPVATPPYSIPGDSVACHMNSLQSSVLFEDTVSVLSYWEPLNPNSWNTHDVDNWGLTLSDRMDPGAGYWVQAFDDAYYVPTSTCDGDSFGLPTEI